MPVRVPGPWTVDPGANRSRAGSGTIRGMKKIIVLVAIAAIAAVIYKVLTTEVPIDE